MTDPLANPFRAGNMQIIQINYSQMSGSVLSDIRQSNSVNIKR